MCVCAHVHVFAFVLLTFVFIVLSVTIGEHVEGHTSVAGASGNSHFLLKIHKMCTKEWRVGIV